MSRTAAEILEEARQLPAGDQDWIIQSLLHEGDSARDIFAAWQKDVGAPVPGYESWFRAGVEEALADKAPDIPHEEVVRDIANLLRAAQEAQKASA